MIKLKSENRFMNLFNTAWGSMEGLYDDHKKFNDTVFGGVGSNVAQRLALAGGSMIGQSGQGAFHPAQASPSKAFPSPEVVPEEKAKKADRYIEVDSTIQKTLTDLQKQFSSLAAGCISSINKCEEEVQRVQKSYFAIDKDVQTFLKIMKGREEIMTIVNGVAIDALWDWNTAKTEIASGGGKDNIRDEINDMVSASSDGYTQENIELGVEPAITFSDFVGRLESWTGDPDKKLALGQCTEVVDCLAKFGVPVDGSPGNLDEFQPRTLMDELKAITFATSLKDESGREGGAPENLVAASTVTLVELAKCLYYPGPIEQSTTHCAQYFQSFPELLKKILVDIFGWDADAQTFDAEQFDLTLFQSVAEHFACAESSRNGLQSELATLRRKRQPMPIADMDKLKTMPELNLFRFALQLCKTEHDFKSLKADFKNEKNLISKLKTAVDKGAADVKSSISKLEGERAAKLEQDKNPGEGERRKKNKDWRGWPGQRQESQDGKLQQDWRQLAFHG